MSVSSWRLRARSACAASDCALGASVPRPIDSSILHIARATDSKTIAEHVGNYKTLEVFRELGIDYAQGFFAGRPGARLKSEPVPVSIGAAKRRKRRVS